MTKPSIQAFSEHGSTYYAGKALSFTFVALVVAPVVGLLLFLLFVFPGIQNLIRINDLQLDEKSDWIALEEQPTGAHRYFSGPIVTRYELRRNAYTLYAEVRPPLDLLIRGQTKRGSNVVLDPSFEGPCMRLFGRTISRFGHSGIEVVPLEEPGANLRFFAPARPRHRHDPNLLFEGIVSQYPLEKVTWRPYGVVMSSFGCGSEESRLLNAAAESPLHLRIMTKHGDQIGEEDVRFTFVRNGWFFDIALP